MPAEERFALAAREGAKAYQIGSFGGLDLEEYRRNADRHGMRCASLAGAGGVGLSTGLTATGKEKAYLNFFTKAVRAAKVLGAQNLVSFVGERQDTIPWETQYKQIISGLRKAGDIAAEAGVYLTNNLREGMAEGLIQFVEVGGVPERVEPGHGEINYQHIFNELRRLGYDGFVGMEHFTKIDFPTAFAQVKRLAGIA